MQHTGDDWKAPDLSGGRRGGKLPSLHLAKAVLASPAMPFLRPRFMLWALAVIWIAMLIVHIVFKLGDLRLWIGFPLLFLPWVLLGPSNWFDR